MPFQPPSKPSFNKKFLIFDFDETIGTLLMDWTDVHDGIVTVIQKYEPEFTVPPDQLNDTWVNAALENRSIEKFGRPLSRDLVEFHRQFEQSRYTGCQPNPAVIQFIHKAQDFDIFLWSNNHSMTVKRALTDMNLTTAIDRMVTCDVVVFPKPNPEGFALLRMPNTSLDDYLMIGDSDNDKGAAAAVGIDYLHVDDFVRLIKK